MLVYTVVHVTLEVHFLHYVVHAVRINHFVIKWVRVIIKHTELYLQSNPDIRITWYKDTPTFKDTFIGPSEFKVIIKDNPFTQISLRILCPQTSNPT